MEAAPGTLLGDRYLIGEEIGRGGMGAVYRATDLRTGGAVAIKVLHAAYAGDRVYRERLRREAQSAALLTSPRVVRVVDVEVSGAAPYLVMEYVGGETLQERLQREGLVLAVPLGTRRQVAMALETLAGTAAAAGRVVRAARLFGAAEALRQALAMPRPVQEQARYESEVAAARDALGAERFATQLAAGRALSVEQALAEATLSPGAFSPTEGDAIGAASVPGAGAP